MLLFSNIGKKIYKGIVWKTDILKKFLQKAPAYQILKKNYLGFNLCHQFKELHTNVKDVFTIFSKLEEKIDARVRKILKPPTLMRAVSMKVLIMNDIKWCADATI